MNRDTEIVMRKLVNNRAIWAAAVIFVAFVAALVINWRQAAFREGAVVLGDNDKISVEIAASAAAREKGLSGRERLDAGHGMLFVFAAPNVYSFWMKDMKFPIDIIWIRGDEVVDLSTEVPVPKPGEALALYKPRQAADRVLEVPSGYCRTHGLRTGEKVSYLIDSGR